MSRVDSWIDFARLLEAPLASWLQPGSAQAQQYSQAAAKARVTNDLNVLEQHLTMATFVVGDSMTIADSQLATTLAGPLMHLIGRKQQEQLPSVIRWFTTCTRHPALAPFVGGFTMCQDSIGWKAPVRSQHPSTPPKQQRPADLSMQQDQEMQAPHDDGDVDSPTASANGPAVQPVSAEKAKKGSKGEVKQAACASDGDQAGASGPEDPEKKAKKDAKAAEKAAKKAKAAAKEAERKAQKDAGPSEKKKKAKDEADAKKAKDAAEVKELIDRATSTPKGHKKDITSDMFKGYCPPAVEAAWYEWWEQSGFFKPELDSDKPPFVIVIPPPNVTGSLHLGHALTNSIQDTVVRWRRMSGYNVLWLPGTDHAGIATQTVVEKDLAKRKGLTRHDLGREAFLEQVFAWVKTYGGKIFGQMRRMGISVDWDRLAFTMDDNLVAAVQEAFVRLFQEGLIYRENRLVNWCCTLHTAVSDIEVDHLEVKGRTLVSVPGYSKQVEVGVLTSFAYPLEDGSGEIVVATTRPETMLGDTAVAVHPDDDRYKHLHGKFVVHPMDGRKVPIIPDAELVDMSFGTGAVKITPAHDPNDYATGKRHNLQCINILDDDGRMNANGGQFAGQPRFTVRKTVVEWLDSKGLLRGTQDNEMSVPFCSRSKDIIEPVLKPQWWVNCQGMAQDGIKAAQDGSLEIIPSDFEATWYRWLENIRDWCVSRQLWWGHRIPAYYISLEGEKAGAAGTQYEQMDRWVVAKEVEQAQAEAQKRFPGKNVTLSQDEDVLDTWFSSGLWPFSTMGWPNQTPELAQFYPGALLETGHDILFFWVARMVMMGIKLTGKVPFKQVYLHSMVRDAHGRKMSKSLGNVIDPLHVIEGISLEDLHDTLTTGNLSPAEVQKATAGQKEDFPDGIEECGTDALRFALVAYTSQGRDINLDIKRVVAYRHWCNKLWNAIKFAMINLGDDFVPVSDLHNSQQLPFGCQWILSRLTAAVDSTIKALHEYQFQSATQAVYSFWQYELCDVFIELIKPVMSSGDAATQQATRETLCTCLDVGLRLLHPFMPFVTEELWQRLPHPHSNANPSTTPPPLQQPTPSANGSQAGPSGNGGDPSQSSIMMQPYPEPQQAWHNPEAEEHMQLVDNAVRAVRKLRNDYGLQRQRPQLFIQCKDRARGEVLSKLAGEIGSLTSCAEVTVQQAGAAAPPGCAPAVIDDSTIVQLLLAGILDPQKEIDKLQKEKVKVEERWNALKKKMATAEYAGKTPAKIKDMDMENLGKAQKEQQSLEQQLHDMKQLLQ
ncbi:TPA: hypothetical protein ACH3X3_001004 [Trebouxia sp. C0006]